jgi:dTDP-4-dehydrorhamnose 3,5-epimerase
MFVETPLPGAYVIELERHGDERGWFARTFDLDRFIELGLDPPNVQCSVSYNARTGTLRGMHYQEAPHGEDKLVRCTRGAIFDAIVDLRRDSPTYCRWFGVELDASGGPELWVPKGCGHGFQTLADDTEVHYQMSYRYVPDAGRGVRWDDAAFGIEWPAVEERIISERDRAYPDFEP